jgi:hypothetical protein
MITAFLRQGQTPKPTFCNKRPALMSDLYDRGRFLTTRRIGQERDAWPRRNQQRPISHIFDAATRDFRGKWFASGLMQTEIATHFSFILL